MSPGAVQGTGRAERLVEYREHKAVCWIETRAVDRLIFLIVLTHAIKYFNLMLMRSHINSTGLFMLSVAIRERQHVVYTRCDHCKTCHETILIAC